MFRLKYRDFSNGSDLLSQTAMFLEDLGLRTWVSGPPLSSSRSLSAYRLGQNTLITKD